jgi:hypothetical protein
MQPAKACVPPEQLHLLSHTVFRVAAAPSLKFWAALFDQTTRTKLLKYWTAEGSLSCSMQPAEASVCSVLSATTAPAVL